MGIWSEKELATLVLYSEVESLHYNFRIFTQQLFYLIPAVVLNQT